MNFQRNNEYDYEHKELIGTGSGGNLVYKIQNIHTKQVISFFLSITIIVSTLL